jgi:hypothetical protein
MNEKDVNNLCEILNKTYNAYYLNKYPQIKDIFIETMDLYQKSPHKFPKTNKTFMSLLYNLLNPEYQPVVDYITGPGIISKYESNKYNKVIYLFGENDHSNTTGCLQSSVDLYGKKHMSIEKYLHKLFKYSPVFIDFYVEFGIMLNKKEIITKNSGQTLWDMLSVMHGCFGPLEQRNCLYNVRMHGVDVRTIKSNIHLESEFSSMDKKLMMIVHTKYTYMTIKTFKKMFEHEINRLSSVKNNKDLLKIAIKNIENNSLVTKELERCILPKNTILNFFINIYMEETIANLPYSALIIGKWFTKLEKLPQNIKAWPVGTEIVSNVLTIINAVTMDIYTAARMFKVFNVKESEQYPKKPHNIVYYAGAGHTIPMGSFLKHIKFLRTEHSGANIVSCASMKGIKQPIFS